FGPIRLVRANSVDGPLATCFVSVWKVQTQSPDRWQISAQVQNSLRWELGRTDTELLNDFQLPTPFWTSEQTGTAFSLLELPDGSPSSVFFPASYAASYPITVAVYSSDHPYGLLASKDDKVFARDPIVGITTNLAPIETVFEPESGDLNFGG